MFGDQNYGSNRYLSVYKALQSAVSTAEIYSSALLLESLINYWASGSEPSLGPRPFPPMRLRKGGWGAEERVWRHGLNLARTNAGMQARLLECN